MNIEIREAEEIELEQVIVLYGQIGMDNGQPLSIDKGKRIFQHMKAYPDYRLYMAHYNGIIVGAFALLIMDNFAHLAEPSAIIEDVVVHKDWRGRRIGWRMMAFAMDVSREKGCYKMVLSSNQSRESAHRFYESMGFQRHGYSFTVDLNLSESYAA